MSELKLLDCPFCGAGMKVEGPSALATGPGEQYVICDCGAMGAGGKTLDDAIKAWNRRPVSAPLDTQALPEDLIAAGALRQYMHNDGMPGFVFAYDKDITDSFIGYIVSQRVRAALKEAKETDAAPYAARIAHLERELAELRVRKDVQEVVDSVEALKDRVRAYKDAARYRILRDLMHSAKGGAALTVNEEFSCYAKPEPGEEVCFQFYPNTPIGSYSFEGTTLDEVADAVLAQFGNK